MDIKYSSLRLIYFSKYKTIYLSREDKIVDKVYIPNGIDIEKAITYKGKIEPTCSTNALPSTSLTIYVTYSYPTNEFCSKSVSIIQTNHCGLNCDWNYDSSSNKTIPNLSSSFNSSINKFTDSFAICIFVLFLSSAYLFSSPSSSSKPS